MALRSISLVIGVDGTGAVGVMGLVTLVQTLEEHGILSTHVAGMTSGLVLSGCAPCFSVGCCCSTWGVDDVSGAKVGALLVDFSLLKTVLILFTYLPSVPRSTFLPLSVAPVSVGVVIVGVAKKAFAKT
jgi:hypothetical protein